MADPGRLNGWQCRKCGEVTYIVHVVDGVTPMFLTCRASGFIGSCDGQAVSLMYSKGPPPQQAINAVAFEWYRPTEDALGALSPDMREHVEKGGLMLRSLTDEGRRLLREGAGS